MNKSVNQRPQSAKLTREQRLAKALRDNLRRRKAGAKAKANPKTESKP
jgi:hypothetical protein